MQKSMQKTVLDGSCSTDSTKHFGEPDSGFNREARRTSMGKYSVFSMLKESLGVASLAKLDQCAG